MGQRKTTLEKESRMVFNSNVDPNIFTDIPNGSLVQRERTLEVRDLHQQKIQHSGKDESNQTYEIESDKTLSGEAMKKWLGDRVVSDVDVPKSLLQESEPVASCTTAPLHHCRGRWSI